MSVENTAQGFLLELQRDSRILTLLFFMSNGRHN